MTFPRLAWCIVSRGLVVCMDLEDCVVCGGVVSLVHEAYIHDTAALEPEDGLVGT